jgi:hypothetical protein
VKCAGCGSPLPAGAGRGRPARYHNATCRQRARRARLAAVHGDVLDALTAVESATSEVRRAVLIGESPDDAGRRLARAAAELTQRLGLPRPGLTTEPTAGRPVTKSVTAPSEETELPQPVPAPNVTKPVTEQPQPARRPRSRRTAPALLDLDTVRQERSTDPIRPGWRVLGGPVNAPVLVGFLEPAYSVTGRRSGRWEARTERLTLVQGGPWCNRAQALVHLVSAYQRVAKHLSRP